MEYKDLQEVLEDPELKKYIVESLHDSMPRLGFSPELTSTFLSNISCLNIDEFIQRHKEELAKVELGHFFGELVPLYFNEYIIPEIPESGKVFDLGCGRGTLIQEIIKRGKNSEIVGIDIKEAPEWGQIRTKNVRLDAVQEEDFLSSLENEQPDIVTATWVFHHMEYAQQERYISSLFKALKPGTSMVVLEDSYSEIMPPESGFTLYEKFMKLDKPGRQKTMGVLDWIANRIFSMRITMPVPFAYRTLEEWRNVFESSGFLVEKMRFLGFPDNRDIHNPQSVLVLKKNNHG